MKKKNEIPPALQLGKRTIETLSGSLPQQILAGLKIGVTSIEIDGCTGKPISGTMLITNSQ